MPGPGSGFFRFVRSWGQKRATGACPGRVPVMANPNTRRALGDAAEELVASWLPNLGLKVLQRNVRLGYLEIDIVAREGSVLAVVEVRRRGATSRTSGFSSINREKRMRLRHAGERLWNRHYKRDPTLERLRFDVASVTFDQTRPIIEYVRGAF